MCSLKMSRVRQSPKIKRDFDTATEAREYFDEWIRENNCLREQHWYGYVWTKNKGKRNIQIHIYASATGQVYACKRALLGKCYKKQMKKEKNHEFKKPSTAEERIQARKDAAARRRSVVLQEPTRPPPPPPAAAPAAAPSGVPPPSVGVPLTVEERVNKVLRDCEKKEDCQKEIVKLLLLLHSDKKGCPYKPEKCNKLLEDLLKHRDLLKHKQNSSQRATRGASRRALDNIVLTF